MSNFDSSVRESLADTPPHIFGVVESMLRGLSGTNEQLWQLGIANDKSAELNSLLLAYAKEFNAACKSASSARASGGNAQPVLAPASQSDDKAKKPAVAG